MTSRPIRRSLHLASIDALYQELDRIEAADREGTLKTTGSWTPGQILMHLAAWIDYGFEGYPIRRPPFFIRWILRWMLHGILRDGMKPGVRDFYLLVAESFVCIAECWIFWMAGIGTREYQRRDWVHSFAAIIAANLASFACGEILWANGIRPW